jgi:hypothetical protein
LTNKKILDISYYESRKKIIDILYEQNNMYVRNDVRVVKIFYEKYIESLKKKCDQELEKQKQEYEQKLIDQLEEIYVPSGIGY